MATEKGEDPALFTNAMEMVLNLKLDLLQESLHQNFQQNLASSSSPTFFLRWSLLKQSTGLPDIPTTTFLDPTNKMNV